MFYIVTAHPDDEVAGWALIEDLGSAGPLPEGLPAASSGPGTYAVFVLLTRGEGTSSCLSPEESAVSGSLLAEDASLFEGFDGTETRTGPYKYQGVDSPVGEDDLGERHPLGNPWQGQGTQACKDARIASWHWFLDDMNRLGGAGTNMNLDTTQDPRLDDDYVGLMCEPGHQGRGDRRPPQKQVGCADVWANEEGARVIFDLGDAGFVPGVGFTASKFTQSDVIAALTLVRDRRSSWGLPLLPQQGIVAPMGYCVHNEPHDPDPLGEHPDHVLVADTVFRNDLGMGKRYGGVHCPHQSENFQSADERLVVAPDPARELLMNYVDPVTEERRGPWVVNYGWLYPTYSFAASSSFYWQQNR